MIEKVDPDTRIDLYLREWRRANADSNNDEPLITYERGWFCFRYGSRPYYKPLRHRAAELAEMQQRLNARANRGL